MKLGYKSFNGVVSSARLFSVTKLCSRLVITPALLLGDSRFEYGVRRLEIPTKYFCVRYPLISLQILGQYFQTDHGCFLPKKNQTRSHTTIARYQHMR